MPDRAGTTVHQRGHGGESGYRHEAFFYADADEFMDGTLDFVRASVAADEPILVVLSAQKIANLAGELGRDAGHVLFADMGEVGVNPARIIPAWQDFLAVHAIGDRPVRGIGEPIWSGRSADEMAECERHEALLNIAFADPDFWLMCPYDTVALGERAVEEARRNHPFVREHRASQTSATFPGFDELTGPFDAPLPDAPLDAALVRFEARDLPDVRAFVARVATDAGLSEERRAGLVLAVHEVAANSVAHGHRRGTLRAWRDATEVVCEVRDDGRIADPLVGRARPALNGEGGRGLWIANQLCELVQLRSFATETVVRLHMRTG
jgi:anti-sigma regulatory factor (Ser/Thr protein kinase)